MKSRLLLFLCLLSAVFILTGCGEKKEEFSEIEVEEGEEKPKAKKKKGFALPWAQEKEEEVVEEEVKRSPEDIMRDKIAEVKAAYEDKKAEIKETNEYMKSLLGKSKGKMLRNDKSFGGGKKMQLPEGVFQERRLTRQKQIRLQKERDKLKNKLYLYKSKLKRMLRANSKKSKKKRSKK